MTDGTFGMVCFAVSVGGCAGVARCCLLPISEGKLFEGENKAVRVLRQLLLMFRKNLSEKSLSCFSPSFFPPGRRIFASVASK